MDAVNGIFIAVALIFGGGYALDKIQTTVKRAAIEQLQGGMPSLSHFTNRLTCAHIAVADGTLVRTKCGNLNKISRSPMAK